jgi:hypothetical protein
MAYAVGLLCSAALFAGCVLVPDSFVKVAQVLTIERVRRELQTRLDDETISSLATKRFIETLPSGGLDLDVVDRPRMRELLRSLGDADARHEASRTSARARLVGAGQGSPVLDELERRSSALVHELCVASAACTLLFGLATWLSRARRSVALAPSRAAARVAACGAVLIGSGYAATWCGLGAS